MTTPMASISGLVSGIQYRDLVDQIIAAESAPAQRLRAQITTITNQTTAIGTYRGLLDTLRTAARSLRDGTAFDPLSVSTSAVSGTRALAGATAGTSAVPGTYRVEVTTLAKAQKLGSAEQASTTTPLDLAAGSFTVNGVSVSVGPTDTLLTLRDKLNAANTGSGASKVSASILSTGPSAHRLVLTSEATGAAGAALADVSGGALQALGLLDGDGAVPPGAVLVAGADAVFAIDGVPLTRASNTVADVVQGVTFTLTGEEAGAVTSVVVERHVEGARKSLQAFVEAYNKVVEFVKQQQARPEEGQSRPPLYNEAIVRTAASTMPRTLLASVLGTSSDLSTPAMAGLSLGQDGKLTLDAAKFDAAFRTRLADVRSLFSQRGTASDARVTYIASGTRTAAGTFDVTITQVPTRASVTGAGFSGTYGGGPDTLTVTDPAGTTVATVALTDGMTTAEIVDAANAAFALTARHKLATGTRLFGDAAGAAPITNATRFSELRLEGGAAVTVNAGETITYAGTRTDGTTFTGTFTITDPTTRTIGDLTAAVQSAYGTAATVTIVDGRVVVEDGTARTSPLALTLTASNESGGTLDFGATAVVTTGRGAMELVAAADGANVRIEATAYGSAPGFTVAGPAQLGISAGTYHGVDVAGILGGNAATGQGRTLTGTTGSTAEGLVVQYVGTDLGAAGSVTVTVGSGAALERVLDGWLAANAGTLASKETSLAARSFSLDTRADDLEARLERRRAVLLRQFAQMETALARLQNSSSGVLATLASLQKSNG